MAREELTIGEVSKPRFEFRTFGQSFATQAQRMARLSVPVPEKVWERTSSEVYIMSRTNDVNNTKIRDGKMDIKTFVTAERGLEQWNPLSKGEFPLTAAQLAEEVFPAFQVAMPDLAADSLTLGEFMQVIADHADLQAVKVHKHRFGYMVNNTICEVAEVLINGARVMTLSSESTEVDDILATLEMVGLAGVENINYLQVIKRVIGWIDRDLAN